MAQAARRHVAKYEPLLEVITDKVNAEVPSPFEGILKEILVEEGATVPNNAEIAVIETADEARPRDGAAASAPSRAGGRGRGSRAANGPAGAAETARSPPTAAARAPSARRRAPAPRARPRRPPPRPRPPPPAGRRRAGTPTPG